MALLVGLVNPSHLCSDMLFPVTLLWCLFSTDQLQDAKRRNSPRDGAGIKMALERGGLVVVCNPSRVT